MSKTRIIKKYPNRRLYDTEESRYITVDDVKALVLKHVDFKVVDAKSEKDITNSTLLQIICEQESVQSPIFTTELLQSIIRNYGHSSQGLFSEFLNQGMQLFEQQLHDYQHQVEEMLQSSPLNYMQTLTKQNLQTWQKAVDQFFSSATQFQQDVSKKTSDNNEK
jgi:polyhydroxyalkanoate synthesis repressor PhaR